MGEAKRRQKTQNPLNDEVLARVSHAIRRLATAASDKFGGDCFLHAYLGQHLLKSLGVGSTLTAGYAAWRTGESDGSVISHTPHNPGYLPAGERGFAFHCWLEARDHLIDFTTYQLPTKAAQLDAMDGGVTEVDWAPPYLYLARNRIRTYREVAQGHTGGCYYERQAAITEKLLAEYQADPEDVQLAQWVLEHPDALVMGPRGLVGEA